MTGETVYYAGSEVAVYGCGRHLPVLVEAGRAALLARAADQTVEDGRRVGDVAAEAVAARLDREDGAA